MQLVSSLISSGLAALVGAGVGGVITYWIVTEDRSTNRMLDAYQSYLPEAVRALTLAQKDDFSKEDIFRFGAAGSVLTVFGSKDVQCRAINFERCLMSDVQKAKQKYGELARTMAEEAGVVFEREIKECVWPPRSPVEGECPAIQ